MRTSVEDLSLPPRCTIDDLVSIYSFADTCPDSQASDFSTIYDTVAALRLPDRSTVLRGARTGGLGVLAASVVLTTPTLDLGESHATPPPLHNTQPTASAPLVPGPTEFTTLDKSVEDDGLTGSLVLASTDSRDGDGGIIAGLKRFVGWDNIGNADPFASISDIFPTDKEPIPQAPAAPVDIADLQFTDFTQPSSGKRLENITPDLPSPFEFLGSQVDLALSSLRGDGFSAPEQQKVAVPAPRVVELPKVQAEVPDTSDSAKKPPVAAQTPKVTGKLTPSLTSPDYTSDILFPLAGDATTNELQLFDDYAVVKGDKGSQVLSMIDGTVLDVTDPKTRRAKKHGSTALIEDNKDGTRWLIEGLGKGSLTVKEGQTVDAGDVIGLLGDKTDGGGESPRLTLRHLPMQIKGVDVNSRPVAGQGESLPTIGDFQRLAPAEQVYEQLSALANGHADQSAELDPTGTGPKSHEEAKRERKKRDGGLGSILNPKEWFNDAEEPELEIPDIIEVPEVSTPEVPPADPPESPDIPEAENPDPEPIDPDQQGNQKQGDKKNKVQPPTLPEDGPDANEPTLPSSPVQPNEPTLPSGPVNPLDDPSNFLNFLNTEVDDFTSESSGSFADPNAAEQDDDSKKDKKNKDLDAVGEQPSDIDAEPPQDRGADESDAPSSNEQKQDEPKKQEKPDNSKDAEARGSIDPDSNTVKGKRMTSEQARLAETVLDVGVDMGAREKVLETAIATTIQESVLKNDSSVDSKDLDSLGLFQQRPSAGWGTRAQISDPKYASRKFYEKAIKIDKKHPNLRNTQLAQKVQISAYPNAYAQWDDEAAKIVEDYLGN